MSRFPLFRLMSAAVCLPMAAQTKASPATAVAAGKYHCVFYIGGQGLQTVPGFTIQTGGKYQHETGSNGSFSFEAAKSLITFQGGALNKQAGKVEAGAKGGVIRLYNESRRRTVIDCDSPRK